MGRIHPNDHAAIPSPGPDVEAESVPMSTADPTRPDRLARDALAGADRLRRLADLALLPVRAVAFWTAALLPLAYLPLLATGFVAANPGAFAALVAVNVVALVAGHGHNQAPEADAGASGGDAARA